MPSDRPRDALLWILPFVALIRRRRHLQRVQAPVCRAWTVCDDSLCGNNLLQKCIHIISRGSLSLFHLHAELALKLLAGTAAGAAAGASSSSASFAAGVGFDLAWGFSAKNVSLKFKI